MPEHVCPWWLGYFLNNPLRKIIENPSKLLLPYIDSEMKILEVGPGMGFFTIPMAKCLQTSGKVYAVDIQEKMLNTLNKIAKKKGLEETIKTRLCSKDSLGLEDLKNQIDFTLLVNVVHEIPNHKQFFSQISCSMKTGGKIYISEPRFHVSKKDFGRMIEIIKGFSFDIVKQPITSNSLSILFEKK